MTPPTFLELCDRMTAEERDFLGSIERDCDREEIERDFPELCPILLFRPAAPVTVAADDDSDVLF